MKIEVAIPCLNEEVTVGKVISDFRSAIPEAEIVVYDNNSKDHTAKIAMDVGAKVIRVNRQGKGYVIQKIFESSTAEIIVLVDGDDTYEAMDVNALIEPLISGSADMTVGTRLHSNTKEFRRMHHFGNRLLTWMLNLIFRTRYNDILSGYRAFNRRFIENVPLISTGFTVEAELTIQALETSMAVEETPIRFRDRPAGSHSKLNTFSDGYNILLMMVALLRDHQPLFVFTLAGILTICFGLPIWFIGFLNIAQNNIFPVFRSIGALLIIFAAGFFLVGLILNAVNTRVRELLSLARRRPL